MDPTFKKISRQYAWLLYSLLTLFVFRVVAQFFALFIDLPFMPPFKDWHGDILPYWALLIFQVSIIVMVLRLARKLAHGVLVARLKIGYVLIAFGGVYLLVMLIRLILGLTILTGSIWFTRSLPIFFHVVLAAILLVTGHFHIRHVKEPVT